MRKKIVWCLGLFLLGAFTCLQAGTVNLVNNSPYKLRAVIRGNDGSFLGEMVINPQDTNQWTDGFAGLPGGFQDTITRTPYAVLWYCLEGDPFATNYFVPSGGTAEAMLGDGAKECRPQKQRQPESEVPAPPMRPMPGQPQGNYQGP